MLQKEKADPVILDKKMPGIGGQGALNGFKKMGLAVPVIILTGSIDLSEDNATEMGCAAILNKPIDLNVLLETINRVLDK